ncbi:MAG: hypothetical protein AAB526_00185 [Patescibacteria group bacterium]
MIIIKKINSFFKKMINYPLQTNQKGSAIFLVILVLAGILVATIGINNLVINGIRFSRNIAWSSPAYFAAETGMEQALYQIRIQNNEEIPDKVDGEFDLNGQIAKWEVSFKCKTEEKIENCGGALIKDLENKTILLIIKSTGTFKNVNRSIELSFCIKGCSN